MNEVVTTTVPAGHHWSGEPGQELADRSGGAGLSPFKGSTADPDAVKDDGDLAGNGNLCLLHADPLREFHPPGLERAPFLGSIKQNGRRLEQISSQKSITRA